MKLILFLVVLLGTSVGFASQECSMLSDHLGEYQIDLGSSDQCVSEYLFGDMLVLSKDGEGSSDVYWAHTGNIGIGVSDSDRSVDKCEQFDGGVLVKICSGSQSCIPRDTSYFYRGNTVIVSINGCWAKYKK